MPTIPHPSRPGESGGGWDDGDTKSTRIASGGKFGRRQSGALQLLRIHTWRTTSSCPKLQPQVSRGTGCPSCGGQYLYADAIRPLPVIRHAGELALLGLPLLLFVPGYLRFFLGIGIIDQRHVFFCSAANKGDATRQQQQKGNRSFRSSSQHK